MNSPIKITAVPAVSSDLTNYEVYEALDDKNQKMGVFNLVRKTLEAGLPFFQSCEHSHKDANEANACDFFNKESPVLAHSKKTLAA